ncbi:hypothetical protein [Dankookia sp. P2]|uniref:hypothetical protein n=1 Tax=Dankookia sp. P2 TaxID=3423955 RepID=UPI003D66DBE2
MPREEDTGPAPGSLLQRGTLSRGAIAGVIGLAVLGGIAWLRADDRPEPPLDAYRRMGLTAGPPALRRDLLAEFPSAARPRRWCSSWKAWASPAARARLPGPAYMPPAPRAAPSGRRRSP